MAQRILGIVLFLCLGTITWLANDRATAQEKRAAVKKGEAPKAADHATDSRGQDTDRQ